MTGSHVDAEQVIRDWLADGAPDRAPESLRQALEEAASRPPARAGAWHFSAFRGRRLAGGIAVAVVILAVAVSGLYIHGSLRPPSPDSSATGSAEPAGSGTSTPSLFSPTPSPQLVPSVAELPGSNWRLVSGALPRMTADGGSWLPIFSLPSGGFIALTGNSRDVRVFKSADGSSWVELARLPAPLGATVSDLTESHGTIVAVGTVYGSGTASSSAEAWTTTDGRTWQTSQLSLADFSSASHVAAGPSGFLVYGSGPSGVEFWVSADGVDWRSVAQTGLPPDSADVNQPELFGNSGGYVLAETFAPRIWQSSDGIRWTQTYRAPALSGMSTYVMGSILRAPDGSYRSFGRVYTGTGIAVRGRVDRLIWTSPDLAHWTQSAGVTDPGLIDGFAAAAGGFVGAGTQPGSSDSTGGAQVLGPLGVWTSSDGHTWKPLAGLSSLQDTQVLAVAGDGSHAVIAAVTGSGDLLLLVGDGRN